MSFDPVATTDWAYGAWLVSGLVLTVQAGLAVLCGYLLVISAASLRPLAATGRPKGRLPRWAVLVPAHDEAATLTRLLASLADLDYPAGEWQVFVIADNCTDTTASVARAAGRRLGLPLTVWERDDAFARGKGHALSWSLGKIQGDPEGKFDGFCVFDADTVVDPACLRAFADSLGAGHQAIQGRYGVLDPDSTPRRRLAYLSAGLYQQARARGREALNLSAGLFGNGMAFDWSIAETIGWPAFSVVEDIEYQAILALHGIRVHYQPEALVWAEAPSTLKASTTQRQRWERGRYALVRYYLGKLVAAARRQHAWMPLAVAVDLIMPSYTLLWALTLVSGLSGFLANGSLALSTFSVTSLSLYLLFGWQQVKGPPWVLKTLLWAPVFAVWVLAVNLKPRPPKDWVRTPRE